MGNDKYIEQLYLPRFNLTANNLYQLGLPNIDRLAKHIPWYGADESDEQLLGQAFGRAHRLAGTNRNLQTRLTSTPILPFFREQGDFAEASDVRVILMGKDVLEQGVHYGSIDSLSDNWFEVRFIVAKFKPKNVEQGDSETLQDINRGVLRQFDYQNPFILTNHDREFVYQHPDLADLWVQPYLTNLMNNNGSDEQIHEVELLKEYLKGNINEKLNLS